MQTEKQAVKLYSELYGTDLKSRLNKLTEEYCELMVASKIFIRNNTKENKESFVDELADLQAVLLHICNIMGYNISDMVNQAFEKCKKRNNAV